MVGIAGINDAKAQVPKGPELAGEILDTAARQLSDERQQRNMGKIAAVLGAAVIILNVADNVYGWNQIADQTILVGGALLAAGEYYAIRK